MKRLRNNQNGYSLTLVLLIVTVIGIMSIPIISSIMNSNSQYMKSEANQQLTDLTQMGELYVQNAVNTSQATAKNNVLTWLQTFPSPTPSNAEIISRFFSEFQTKMNTYFPDNYGTAIGKTITLKDNSFQYQVKAMIDTTGKNVQYTVTPSLNGVFDTVNSTSGNISLAFTITPSS